MKENPDLKMFVDEEAPGMSVDDEEDQIPELMAFQVTNTETGHVYIGDYEPYVTLIVVLADLSHVAGVSPYSIHLETDHEVLEHYSQKCEELFEGQAIVHLEFSIKQCPDFIFGGVGEIETLDTPAFNWDEPSAQKNQWSPDFKALGHSITPVCG